MSARNRPARSVGSTLATLKAAGVLRAEFHPDGRLASVIFAPPEPEAPTDTPKQGVDSNLTRTARQEVDFLGGAMATPPWES